VSAALLERRGRPWAWREDSAQKMFAPPYPGLVINIGDKGGAGTHWTAGKYVPEANQVLYADPFGTILRGHPPSEIAEEAKRRGSRVLANGIAFQRLETDLCGWYSLLFAEALEGVHRALTLPQLEHLLWHSVA
jgi:hypothetical protein